MSDDLSKDNIRASDHSTSRVLDGSVTRTSREENLCFMFTTCRYNAIVQFKRLQRQKAARFNKLGEEGD